MSADSTRKVIMNYIDSNHTDLSVMAPDVVFRTMATGEEVTGPEAVRQMLTYMYHTAFDARAEVRSTVITDGKAVVEMDFVGKHIGEFAGIPATGKSVSVPLCVAYDLEGDKVKRARVYMELPALFEQLGKK